jgi:hypothetical protein
MKLKSILVTGLAVIPLVVAFSLVATERPTDSLAASNSPGLSIHSSKEEILAVLDDAHFQYRTLYVQATEIEDAVVKEVKLWLSQPEAKYRYELANLSDPSQSSTHVSNGVHTRAIGDNIHIRDPEGPPLLTNAVRPEYIVARPAEPDEDTVYPSWINLAVGGRISTLMAPTILAQGLLRQSDIEIVGKETVAGRDTLQIVVQLPDGNTDLFWIDLATGVILREELYSEGQLRFSLVVDAIQFDPPIHDSDRLFSVEPVK